MPRRFRDGGSTVVGIEHNRDVIKIVDLIIDLSPEGSGTAVIAVTPEEVVSRTGSYTVAPRS